MFDPDDDSLPVRDEDRPVDPDGYSDEDYPYQG